jgi:solute carrier family 34 (sodium-dependent phosphate cotransporter)
VGVGLFFPLPLVRHLPLRAARWVAVQAVQRRTTVLVYIVMMFVVIPLIGVITL